MSWSLDKQHLELGFAAKHMMVATVKGRFTDVDAEVHLDEQHPEASFVRANVVAASLTTGAPDRDAHLKSADFFDVERYPALTFVSREVRRKGDDLELTGDLTIKDVTRPVTLKGEYTGPVQGPWGGRHLGFSLTGEIDREDFGLTWNVALEAGGVLVSRKVKLSIDAEVKEDAAAAA